MSIVSLIIVLVIVGLLLYAIQLLPIDPTIHRIIQIVAIIGVVLWLVSRFVPGVL